MEPDDGHDGARPTQQVEGSPSDNDDVASVLRHFAEEGYRTDLRPGTTPGTLVCCACKATSPVQSFEDVVQRRMEGASDPDDMVMVVAARCPECRAGGTVVVGFGPNSAEADADIVVALP